MLLSKQDISYFIYISRPRRASLLIYRKNPLREQFLFIRSYFIAISMLLSLIIASIDSTVESCIRNIKDSSCAMNRWNFFLL
jgi:hypothetical protein